MIDRIPRVFISYSWAVHKKEVRDIAENLRNDGIDAILDVWDLKPGQDAKAFMERCVSDPEIDRVLIMCDKSYMEKANMRSGGVGDETMVISPEVYGNAQQEKFIPVIIELDDNGNPYLPVYLKSRKYINIFDDKYEVGYEELIRTIYEEPESRKPALGKPPMDILKEESTHLIALKVVMRRLEADNFSRINLIAIDNFLDKYLESLKYFYNTEPYTIDNFLESFSCMREHRDYFLKFLEILSESGKITIGEFLAEAFERIYNTLCDLYFFVPQVNKCYNDSFDIFKLHIWELFLCSMTYLLQRKLFSEIHDVLFHTYFLRRYVLDEKRYESNYGVFCFQTYELEERIKRDVPSLRNYLTPIGHLLCTQRERSPIYTQRAIAETDLFLFQVFEGLEIGIDNSPLWFPKCYIYNNMDNSIWQKLKSKKFCEKVFRLFDIQSIDSLKQKISRCRNENANIYDNARMPALTIKNFIVIDDIGVLP